MARPSSAGRRGRSARSGGTRPRETAERPAYLAERDGGWVRGLAGRRPARRVDDIANGLLALGVRKGDAFAILGLDEPRVVPVRLRARPDRRDRRARSTRTARRRTARTCSTTRSRSACSSRTTSSSRRSRRCAAGCRASATCSRSRTCPSSRRAAARYAAEHPDALDDASAAGRRGRPLHLHLHLGHDRPAEGLHDPPPQLLRDGRRRRRDADGFVEPDGHAAPLPPARPQLRAADAPPGAVRRLHDRLLPRPAARRRGARRRSGRPSSRACRACTRRCTPPSLASFDEAQRARSARLVDWALGVGRRGEPAAPGRQAGPAARSRSATASPTGSSTRR